MSFNERIWYPIYHGETGKKMQSKIAINSSLIFPNFPEVKALKKKVTYIRQSSSGLFDLKAVRYVQKKSLPFQLRNLLWQGVDQIRRILPSRPSKEEQLLLDVKRPLQFLPTLSRVERLQWIYEPRLEFPKSYSFIGKKPKNDKLVPIRKVSHKYEITFPLRFEASLKGTLLQEISSFLYLKVDEKLFSGLSKEYKNLWGDRFESYETLFPYLKTYGVVITADEIKKFHLSGKLKELGQKVYFGIKEIVVETFEDHPEYESVLYVEIDSPALQSLQRKHIGKTTPIRLFLAVKRRAVNPIAAPLCMSNLSYHFC